MSESIVKTQHQTALFTKDGLFAGFFFVITQQHRAVVKYDPRQNPPYIYFSFETTEGAKTAFKEHVAKTVENGWSLFYQGRPNFG